MTRGALPDVQRDRVNGLNWEACVRYQEECVTTYGSDQKALFRVVEGMLKKKECITPDSSVMELSDFFDDKILQIRSSLDSMVDPGVAEIG